MKKLTLILSILVLAFFKSQTNELWGMTRQGANNSNGVIFSYNPNTNVYTKKWSLTDLMDHNPMAV